MTIATTQPRRPTARDVRASEKPRNAAFSLLEMVAVMTIMGLLIAIAVPKIARIIQHERVNHAAQIVVADLQNGFAMAGRQRAPVRLTFTSSTKSYVFTDRATGKIFQVRFMDNGSEYALSSLTSVPATVDVLPNGIGSTAFTVTVAQGNYSRKVTASSAGFVRLVPL
jgi:prepilin-type N-terminal cleavage/methylation domain-containing protein